MNRIESIDRLKGIAIILVIMGHIIQFNNIDGGLSNKLFNIIYSFHMPLFFIISGYVANRTNKSITNTNSLLKFIWKKSYSLVLPMLIWSLIVDKYFFAQSFQLITIEDVINSILKPGLWFLQVLFEIQILFGIYSLIHSRLNKKENILLSVFILFLILLTPVLGVITIDKSHFMSLILYSFFFFTGSLISEYTNIENFILKNKMYFIALISFLLFTAQWSINGNIIDDLLKIIISLSAFIVLFQISQTTILISFFDDQVQLFGRSSLAIYLLQFYLTSKIVFFSKIENLNIFLLFIIVLLIAIPIAYLSIIVQKIFERSTLLSFLLYGRKR